MQNLENDRRYYFRVTAVDRDGSESPFSNEESTVVYLYDPNQAGQNMVRNGDFSEGPAQWTLTCGGLAQAQWAVEAGRAHVKIGNGGQDNYNLRLIQTGLKLVRRRNVCPGL